MFILALIFFCLSHSNIIVIIYLSYSLTFFLSVDLFSKIYSLVISSYFFHIIAQQKFIETFKSAHNISIIVLGIYTEKITFVITYKQILLVITFDFQAISEKIVHLRQTDRLAYNIIESITVLLEHHTFQHYFIYNIEKYCKFIVKVLEFIDDFKIMKVFLDNNIFPKSIIGCDLFLNYFLEILIPSFERCLNKNENFFPLFSRIIQKVSMVYKIVRYTQCSILIFPPKKLKKLTSKKIVQTKLVEVIFLSHWF